MSGVRKHRNLGCCYNDDGRRGPGIDDGRLRQCHTRGHREGYRAVPGCYQPDSAYVSHLDHDSQRVVG